jgi:hypothetical protein
MNSHKFSLVIHRPVAQNLFYLLHMEYEGSNGLVSRKMKTKFCWFSRFRTFYGWKTSFERKTYFRPSRTVVRRNLCHAYSRLERFCMGKFQTHKLTRAVSRKLRTLIRNNFCPTIFQNFECGWPRLGLEDRKMVKKLKILMFFWEFERSLCQKSWNYSLLVAPYNFLQEFWIYFGGNFDQDTWSKMTTFG